VDQRTDDFIGEVEVRSDDRQEVKSIELFAHDFRVNDHTGEVDFKDEEVRKALLENVERAVLLTVHHEIGGVAEATSPQSS
jgi:hypothetical protein